MSAMTDGSEHFADGDTPRSRQGAASMSYADPQSAPWEPVARPVFEKAALFCRQISWLGGGARPGAGADGREVSQAAARPG